MTRVHLRRHRVTTPSHPPLKREAAGIWKSQDGEWTFMRHQSDPRPQRWFAYFQEEQDAANMGEGHTRLADVAHWALGDR